MFSEADNIDKADKAGMRAAAIAELRARGFEVTNASRGAGSQPYSQVDLLKNGKTLRCAIKLTMRTQGRIHFAREDNIWKVLGTSDLVLHVWHHPERPGELRLMMFEAATVKEAFHRNFEAAVAGGFAHIPAWLSPVPEPGERFTGSGFGPSALWVTTVPFGSSKGVADTKPSAPPSGEGGLMAQIKGMLAEHMGVPADRIEVDVRVKF